MITDVSPFCNTLYKNLPLLLENSLSHIPIDSNVDDEMNLHYFKLSMFE